MAPRRGGGVRTGGVGGGGQADDDYDPSLVYQTSELRAMRGEIACASLLLVAAIIALGMTTRKSWFQYDGLRNKSRLSIFVSSLISVMVGRAVFIANTALILQGPNDIGQADYYHTLSLLVQGIISSFFDMMSSILFFGLVLIEITRQMGQADAKKIVFEKLSSLAIVALLAVDLTNWIIDTYVVVHDDYEEGSSMFSFDVRRDLNITSLALAVLLALAMLLRTPSRGPWYANPIVESRNSHLRNVAGWLFMIQSLYLIGSCFALFYDGHNARTIQYVMWAVADIIWIGVFLMLILLARDDHKLHQARRVRDDVVSTQQTHLDTSSLSHKTSTDATVTGAPPQLPQIIVWRS